MHAGTPNTPSITSLSLIENDITINWMIDIHELRPVDKYLIQVQITGSNDQESNSGSEFLTSGDDQWTNGANGASFGGSSRPFEGQVFNITVSESVDDLTCSVNAKGDINHCEYTLIQETEIGLTYSFIVCATNDFGTACGDSRNITATPPAVTLTSSSAPPLVTQVSTTVTPPQPAFTTLTPQDITNSQTVTIVPHGTLTTSTNAQLLATPLSPPRSGPKTPTGLEGVFVGITFGVVVVVLLCCVLWVSILLLCVCCCLRREREKNYWPEEIG